MPASKRGKRWQEWHLTRDVALFTVGLGIIIQQSVFAEIDRPYLLALAGWMVGLPVFLSSDLRREREGSTS
jgi:hypothetical protein